MLSDVSTYEHLAPQYVGSDMRWSERIGRGGALGAMDFNAPLHEGAAVPPAAHRSTLRCVWIFLAVLQETIGVFHASSLKMMPTYAHASCIRGLDGRQPIAAESERARPPAPRCVAPRVGRAGRAHLRRQKPPLRGRGPAHKRLDMFENARKCREMLGCLSASMQVFRGMFGMRIWDCLRL